MEEDKFYSQKLEDNMVSLCATVIKNWIINEDITVVNGIRGFTGTQKAAIFCISLGEENASEIFKKLNENEIETITWEISRFDVISPEWKTEIFNEFEVIIKNKNFVSIGGVDYARKILENSFGSQKAIDTLNRLTSSLQIRPFDFIRKCDPTQLLNFLQQEHPQAIAVVLSFLEPNKSAVILQNLPEEIQADVVKRIATMDYINPEILREVERVLEKKLSQVDTTYLNIGGVESVIEILNMVDRATEKQIIESLEDELPELSDEVKKKMFIFEDLIMLDDRSIQKIMREVDSQELAKALKEVDIEVQDKIFRNMSNRAATMLKEDMDYMGPIRLKDVEEAQQRIVSVVRHLEDCGEIIIARAGEDEIVGTEKFFKANTKKQEFYNFVNDLNKDQINYIFRNVGDNYIIKSLIWVQPEIKNKFLSSLKLRDRIKYKWWIRQAKKRCFNLQDMLSSQEEIMKIEFTNGENNV